MHPITGRPFRELKPWYQLKTAAWIDIEIARGYGKQLWDYYAGTTPRQRLFERIFLYAAQQRDMALAEYRERTTVEERRQRR